MRSNSDSLTRFSDVHRSNLRIPSEAQEGISHARQVVVALQKQLRHIGKIRDRLKALGYDESYKLYQHAAKAREAVFDLQTAGLLPQRPITATVARMPPDSSG